MEKIVSCQYQEEYYIEVLANGLSVVIWHKPNFNNSYFAIATPYGSFGINQKLAGKNVKYNAGLAHFLEHKMFESVDTSDVMEEFTAMGCNVNAYTSYNETVY